jgi:hypothetical protein
MLLMIPYTDYRISANITSALYPEVRRITTRMLAVTVLIGNREHTRTETRKTVYLRLAFTQS